MDTTAHTETAHAAVERKKRGAIPLRRRFGALLRRVAQPVGWAAALFLCTFVKWFGIPSPFAAALLLGLGDKPPALMLLGGGAALLLRVLWGLETDAWQFAGLLCLWVAQRRLKVRPGIETAALCGLAMMPRVVAALVGGQPLQILLSLAAVPVGMLSAAFLRESMEGVAATGAPTCARERAGLLLIGLWLVSGLGFFRVGDANLGQAAAVALVCAYACANGPVYGVMGGMLCGLALALGGFDCGVAVPLAVCGLLCGLPPLARWRGLCVPAALGAWLLGAFLTPAATPPLGLWAALAGGVGCRLIPARVLEGCKAGAYVANGAQSMDTAFVTQRIAHMQDAVQRLARALPRFGEDERSSGEELGTLLCAQCANREMCWGRGRARTERLLTGMMELSKRGEPIDEDKLPALAEHGCLRAEAIPELARDALMQRSRRSIAIKKARYERELTLTHLAALSGTLGELSEMAVGNSFNDLQAAHIINLAMEELGVPARLRYARRVDGHLQAALESEGMLPIPKPLEALLRYLAMEENMPLSIARAEHGHIELEEIPLYSASVGSVSLCAGERGEGGVCGDACSTKRCEGGRLLMMLCDGMGHGQAAHQQSEKTLELLLLLLEAGYTRRQAITAVNGIMLGAQEDERFSTVDLADVDLWTGEVYSEKLGACASWVVRGNHLRKIEGSSLPLGIMEEARPTAAQYRLHSGDILVLMSDGVTDAFESEEQLRKAILDNLYIQPQRMADALLRSALLAGGGAPRDDMSVMVLLLIDRQQAG